MKSSQRKIRKDTQRALINIGGLITARMDGDRGFRNKLKQAGVLDAIDREMFYAVNGYPEALTKRKSAPWRVRVIRFFLWFKKQK